MFILLFKLLTFLGPRSFWPVYKDVKEATSCQIKLFHSTLCLVSEKCRKDEEKSVKK